MKGLESPRGNLDQDDSRPTTQEDFKNELKISKKQSSKNQNFAIVI